MTTPDGSEIDVAAGELALGLLEGEERAVALRRMLSDPAFAAEVDTWRAQFATLLDNVPDAQPSERLADRVAASVAEHAQGASRWRAATAGMAAIAAALLAVILLRPDAAAPPTPVQQVASAPLVAALAPTGKGVALAASYDATSHEVRLTPLSDTPSAHDAELWAIGTDGVPHSLGLLNPHNPSRIVIADASAARLAPGVALAISIEPAGGSPTGLPTGPVVASGALQKI